MDPLRPLPARWLVVLVAFFASFLALPCRAAPDESWLATVTANIRESEYHVSPSSEGAGLTAPNRANDLRALWQDGVLRLSPRVDASAWTFSYSLASVARADRPVALEVSSVRWESVDGGRIEWARDGLVESYVNDERGIEQGFVLERRPEGEPGEAVVLAGRIAGLLAFPASDDASVLLRAPTGESALSIRDLRVEDAAGTPLPSCLSVSEGMLEIRFDDRPAIYPVTVDPLMTSPAWVGQANQADASFGQSVATAGDVNGDGYSDVIVGADRWDNGEDGEGGAFLFLGSPSGLSTTPAWTAESNEAGAGFGRSVATAGDVNADGYSDVIVGAYAGGFVGAAFAYLGSPTGLGTTAAWTADGSAGGRAFFGWSVGTAGDVNGDGYSDVIVGAFGWQDDQLDEGAALVFEGSATGLATTPAWTEEGDQDFGEFATSVSTAGDVNGDGFSDVLVGARLYDDPDNNEGAAFLYLGSATGLATTPAWTAEGNQPTAEMVAVATAGDIDGDGYSDVIVGVHSWENPEFNEGRALLFRGSATGLGVNPAWSYESNQARAELGASVATAGDVNGDGFADVIVGSPVYDNGQSDEGTALVFEGSASGLSTTPTWTAEGGQPAAYFGVSVATAGDVNGDGYSDVVVGSSGYSSGQASEGAAFAYLGSAAGLGAAPGWTTESNHVGARLGFSVASAGDVNGDGFSDVVIGASQYDGGQADEGAAFAYHGSPAGLGAVPAWTAEGNQVGAELGTCVATAGDVNGDGYSDVIVGARLYDDGQIDEGAAFAYLGSPTGLGAARAWTVESDQAGAGFGVSVATAGDVNGDGYSDVIVGADAYDDGEVDEGRAFVYHGSGSGLALVPAWTAESNQAAAAFGISVASAGDVNGDGFSDVVVGAPAFDDAESNEGAAFAYLGSTCGLGPAAWTAEQNQVGAGFGSSVAGAGDVNGDGYSDVIVGARQADSGQIDEGRAFVYHGSAAGLSATVAWRGESNQAGAAFGGSVASAGDVNGDGYSDVIIGASLFDNGQSDEGRAFAYLGSGSGLANVAAWTAESDRASAELGGSVASAGDVNGDGYSDVIVGADHFSRGEADEGAAFLFYGNAGDGLDRLVRQRRFDDLAPLAILGATRAADGFRMAANGRTPFGRDQVRFEWEVKPLGTPFDGTGIGVSPWVDTGAPGAAGSVTPFDRVHAPLPADGPYHWRLRLRSHYPFPWQSHWMGMPDNSRTETDFRAGGTDNCPGVSNPGQEDGDADCIGDACDACPLDPANDVDSDGLCANADNCPDVANPLQQDSDSDLVGDACDACPLDPANDADADSVCDDVDNCDSQPNPLQEDFDGDGIGDACECIGVPALPDEGVGDSLRSTNHGDFSWTPPAGALRYPVMRGTIPTLGGMGSRVQPYDHACLLTAVTSTFSDPSSPGAPGAFYYLVGCANDCSAAASAMGRDSAGVLRPDPGCP